MIRLARICVALRHQIHHCNVYQYSRQQVAKELFSHILARVALQRILSEGLTKMEKHFFNTKVNKE